jgi:hypothetical protein
MRANTTRRGTAPALAHSGADELVWRFPLVRLRWLLLGSVCAAAPACGGRASLADEESGSSGSSGTSTNAGVSGAGSVPASGAGGVGSAGTHGGASGAGPYYTGASGSVGAGGSEAVQAPPALLCEGFVRGGWERCNDGVLHRAQTAQCPSQLPRPLQLATRAADAGVEPPIVQCERDGDCTERAHGECVLSEGFSEYTTYCRYGCTQDDECPAGSACVCGDVIGTCQQAHCRSDSDCSPGLACLTWDSPSCGGGYTLSCQTTDDECIGDADCPGQVCGVDSDSDMRRRCKPREPCPVPGRPFLIDGEARRARVDQRCDWSRASSDVAGELEPGLREALAAHWLEQGLMEHASVAAFARFTLQLLSVGAPAELVAASARAMQDEIAHAEGCFGLARLYSRRDLGPGPLPLAGALERSDLWSIVHDTVLEGCIGETVAAVEAGEAGARCEDDGVRPLLERIAREEYQHATLAWHFLRWALARDPGLAPRVQALFARVLSEREAGVARALEPNASDLGRHGVLSPELRRSLEQRVLREVVAPCAHALCGASAAAHEEARGVGAPLA